jgi:hypothetical protein
MHSSPDVPFKSDAYEIERISVAQIRMQTGGHVAIVGEFREADRLLMSWLDHATQDFLEFRAQIVFQDGFVFHFHYDFGRCSRRRPSLSKLVNEAFSGGSEAIGKLPESPELYEINSF